MLTLYFLPYLGHYMTRGAPVHTVVPSRDRTSKSDTPTSSSNLNRISTYVSYSLNQALLVHRNHLREDLFTIKAADESSLSYLYGITCKHNSVLYTTSKTDVVRNQQGLHKMFLACDWLRNLSKPLQPIASQDNFM